MRRALSLILKLVSRTAHACALRISTLNHEIGNHAMKNRPIVEPVFRLLARGRMRPLPLTLGKLNKIGDRLRRVLFKQPANDRSFRGFKRSVESRLTSHKIPFAFVNEFVAHVK